MRIRTAPLTARIILSLSMVLGLAACGGGGGGGTGPGGDPGPDPDPGPSEFLATLADFQGFETWTVLDYSIGDTNPLLAGAHQVADEGFSRIVRALTAGTPGTSWPTGTILVLETFTWNGETKEHAAEDGLVAMVKRGGEFDPAGGGWEWFRLAPDLSAIVERGDSGLAGGSCAACHVQATGSAGLDRVFSHPADRAPTAADFADYSTWPEIDSAGGFHALLNGWHEFSGSDVRRRVFKRQLLARADIDLGGYPTGTVIVKSVEGNQRIIEVSAMVKRGEGFDPPGGNWEWFGLDSTTVQIRSRGADLAGGACRICHGQASDPAIGADWVFRHAGDPFNR